MRNSAARPLDTRSESSPRSRPQSPRASDKQSCSNSAQSNGAWAAPPLHSRSTPPPASATQSITRPPTQSSSDTDPAPKTNKDSPHSPAPDDPTTAHWRSQKSDSDTHSPPAP